MISGVLTATMLYGLCLIGINLWSGILEHSRTSDHNGLLGHSIDPVFLDFPAGPASCGIKSAC